MMDASYLVALAVFFPLGFFAARVASRFRLDSEAQQRAADGYPVADTDTGFYGTDTGPRAGTEPEPYSYRHDNGWYLDQYRNAGRRAIPRDNNGPRPGRHALGRDLDFANAQAVGGYDLDGD